MDILKRLLSLALLFVLSSSLYAQDETRIWVEKDTVRVGSISKYVRMVNLDIPVYNAGDAPLKIKSIETDCVCTTVKYDKEPIASATYQYVHVAIDIRKYFSGEMQKNIFIMSNASEPKKVVTFIINVED